MLAYVVEEGGRLTGEQLPVPGAEEIMAGFIRCFGGRDATRVSMYWAGPGDLPNPVSGGARARDR